MARIANVNIPANKRLVISLTYIHGIGLTTAKNICVESNISPNKRVKDLTDEELIALRTIIENKYKVEGELRKEVSLNIKTKKEIKCYQGFRHIKRLPVRGQRTHTNARTLRGKAVAIAGKKKVAK